MEFIKLTPKKFLLAAFLFALFAWLSPLFYGYIVLDAKLIGLPLPFAFKAHECVDVCRGDFFWFQLIVDLLFWYLISSVLFHLNKITRK